PENVPDDARAAPSQRARKTGGSLVSKCRFSQALRALKRKEQTMPATEPLIFDAIRTPRGRGKVNGALHTTKPVDLVVGLMHEVLSRNANLDPKRLDDVVLGCVSPIGDQGADIAKTAAIKAGLPDTVSGVQLNRFCASGLEAVNIAAQKV